MGTVAAFEPDWVSPPGNTIERVIRQKGLSLPDLASILESSDTYVQDLIDGKEPLKEKEAKALSDNIGASYDFWMNREIQYRTSINILEDSNYKDRLLEWMRSLPTRDIKNYGWMDLPRSPIEKAKSCLQYFGITNLQEWEQKYDRSITYAAFRTSDTFEPDIASVSAWIRQGEIKARSIDCAPWDRKKFKNALPEIKKLTRIKDPCKFLPKLINLCAQCGVAIAIVRTPSGCRASGATKFVSENKALMMLSFRYLRDDQFWFTFFHEAGHLILHGDSFFLEERRTNRTISEEEREANEFAEDTLIGQEHKAELKKLKLDKRSIVKFARKAGVSAGIVVGQLQFLERVEHRRLNGYKKKYDWEEISKHVSL